MVDKEQRRYPRREFRELPWIFTVQFTQPVPMDHSVRFEAKNISMGGLKFISNQRISLFSEISFLFFEKEKGREIGKIRGKVVRLEEIDTGIGEKTFGIAVELRSEDTASLRPYLEVAPS